MDPDANLAELLPLAKRAADDPYALVAEDVARLGELVEALDGWLSQGGHRPRRWQRAEPR